MRAVQTGPIIGLTGQLALLAGLSGAVGFGGPGWLAGVGWAALMNGALARGLTRCHTAGLRPADRVTLVRAVITGGVAAVTAESFRGPIPLPTIVALAALALVLDGVDGWVARRTDTASVLGARFDMEVDAFLILVLSVFVAHRHGAWVLAIGLARYAFVAARHCLPWMSGSVPPRYWCKVVAATQGVVLTVAAADVLPSSLTEVLVGASLALLMESFGRESWWLWRHRHGEGRKQVVAPQVVRADEHVDVEPAAGGRPCPTRGAARLPDLVGALSNVAAPRAHQLP